MKIPDFNYKGFIVRGFDCNESGIWRIEIPCDFGSDLDLAFRNHVASSGNSDKVFDFFDSKSVAKINKEEFLEKIPLDLKRLLPDLALKMKFSQLDVYGLFCVKSVYSVVNRSLGICALIGFGDIAINRFYDLIPALIRAGGALLVIDYFGVYRDVLDKIEPTPQQIIFQNR
jgi:hypothetical protein